MSRNAAGTGGMVPGEMPGQLSPSARGPSGDEIPPVPAELCTACDVRVPAVLGGSYCEECERIMADQRDADIEVAGLWLWQGKWIA